ncbi:threonine synthase [Candidatus Sumerlaeota bacterium]|nr:threonine synthase [Candidatus Sumerlaeota bacterium]
MTQPILFWSTNDPERRKPGLDFSDALMQGLAPDKGLYIMRREDLPQVSAAELAEFSGLPYSEIAFRIMRPFVEGRIPSDVFHAICEDAYNFDVPVEQYAPGRHILRLDRGPTASFKDFAARMMARLMQHFLKEQGRSATILTATSGDTGGAVAAAFHGLENVRVAVLYPGTEVSARQRRQMTTLKDNVFAIDIDGKFDDCQALVKHAFVDPDLTGYELTSANSINVGRLIPQSVYYFYAASRVQASEDKPLAICVPSGNFGNLMGGLLAKHMGLPVAKYLAAVNENDEVPIYWRTEEYRPVAPSRNCLSNAMNVGHPSNLSRVVALYGGTMDETGEVHAQPDMDAMRRDIASVEVSDEETRLAIRECYQLHKTVIEPHGAVGYCAVQKLGFPEKYTTIFLETAHPAKFPEVGQEVIGVDPELPESMQQSEAKSEVNFACSAEYAEFKEMLVDLLSNTK